MVGFENGDSTSPQPPSYTHEMPSTLPPVIHHRDGRARRSTQTSSPPAVPAVTRHAEYYSERGNLTLQVKDTIFKVSEIPFWDLSEAEGVPGQFFKIVSKENGTTFQDVTNEKAELAPRCETHIWVLKDVEVDDFTRLLWVIQPRDPGECKATTLDDWTAILKLADRWMFKKAFNRAVRALSGLKIDPIKKIRLMHDRGIRREWAIDAFVLLAIAESFPDVKDAEVLGIELATYLAKTREKAGYMMPWNRRRYEAVKPVVCEVFKLDGALKDSKYFDWKAV